jgi:hypothetical protein
MNAFIRAGLFIATAGVAAYAAWSAANQMSQEPVPESDGQDECNNSRQNQDEDDNDSDNSTTAQTTSTDLSLEERLAQIERRRRAIQEERERLEREESILEWHQRQLTRSLANYTPSHNHRDDVDNVSAWRCETLHSVGSSDDSPIPPPSVPVFREEAADEIFSRTTTAVSAPNMPNFLAPHEEAFPDFLAASHQSPLPSLATSPEIHAVDEVVLPHLYSPSEASTSQFRELDENEGSIQSWDVMSDITRRN